jgi:ABC-type lipoprotein export system ATPase subunit
MITVFYGENGSGKTTILKILHAILSKDESILLQERVQRIHLTYSVDDHNTNGIIKKIARVWLEENEETQYNWTEFEGEEWKESSSILFGVNRGTTMGRLNLNPESIIRFITRSHYYKFFEGHHARIRAFSEELIDYINYDNRRNRHLRGRQQNIFDHKHLRLDNINIENIEDLLIERYRYAKYITSQRVTKALFDTLSIAITPAGYRSDSSDFLPDNFPKLLQDNKERLIEALSSSTENTLRNQLIDILRNFDQQEFENSYTQTKLLSNLLYKMILELESEKSILNSINVLIDVFNDQISDWKRMVVTQDQTFIDLGDEHKHNLSELSSGERHLLSFLTLFIIEGNNRNFLMIDEPEISLNIKWQRKLLPLLSQLAPNAQIIVASHSASIAKSNTRYLVEVKSHRKKRRLGHLGRELV